jgi:hypothetical protein
MTTFADRAFKEVIKAGKVIIQHDWCPYRKSLEKKHTHEREREDHMETQGEDSHL